MRATLDDLDDILMIENRSFSSPWSRDMFSQEFKEGSYAHVFIAKPLSGCSVKPLAENRLLGYICVSMLFDELHILNIAVDIPCRRLGVATALLHFTLDYAKENGVKSAFLEVRQSHTVTIGIYEKLGFVAIAWRKKYYSDNGEDAIVMLKKMSEV